MSQDPGERSSVFEDTIHQVLAQLAAAAAGTHAVNLQHACMLSYAFTAVVHLIYTLRTVLMSPASSRCRHACMQHAIPLWCMTQLLLLLLLLLLGSRPAGLFCFLPASVLRSKQT
jgi:hypothetical protein